jgi:hypothetical protein
MANAQRALNESTDSAWLRVWHRLEAAHDGVFTEANKARLRQFVIRLSIAGFLIHLALICWVRSAVPAPQWIAGVGTNYLTAISTPFNFILFYEVLTLIAALPESTTRSIANQFEIVSLIYIRDVFRDIAKMGNMVSAHRVTLETLPMFLDMGAGFLMYLLVAVFQNVAQRRRQTPSATPERARFTAQKKVIAAGLTALLLCMAAYNLALFFAAVWHRMLSTYTAMAPATTFYDDLFTVMIFTDVLILILSLVVSAQYENVFRNAAFVVSIIMIRFSLTEGYPYGAPLALMAMVFGILTLMVFNYHVGLTGDEAHST